MTDDKIMYYSDKFSSNDNEIYKGSICNSDAELWMKENTPLIDIPDRNLEEIYYFRWWTFRKHTKKVDCGHIITEFLPNVGWSGRFNTIVCATAHHITEARWLRNTELLDDYILLREIILSLTDGWEGTRETGKSLF